MELRLRGVDGAFRWFLTRAIPVRDVNGAIVRWYGSNTDIDAEHGARVRERFFSLLGAELSGALSLEQTLRVVTRRIVPEFADWALVNLIDEHGDVRLAAAYHRDPDKRDMLDALRGEPYRERCGKRTARRRWCAPASRPSIESVTEAVLHETVDSRGSTPRSRGSDPTRRCSYRCSPRARSSARSMP